MLVKSGNPLAVAPRVALLQRLLPVSLLELLAIPTTTRDRRSYLPVSAFAT